MQKKRGCLFPPLFFWYVCYLLFGLAEVAVAALGRRACFLPLRCQLFMASLTLCVVDPFETLFPNIIRLVALTALLGGLAFFLFPCVVAFRARYLFRVRLMGEDNQGLYSFRVLVVNGDLISLRQGDADDHHKRTRHYHDEIEPSLHVFPPLLTRYLQKDLYRQDIFVKVFKKMARGNPLGLSKK
jgi:hypothetical protein